MFKLLLALSNLSSTISAGTALYLISSSESAFIPTGTR